jgi:hypothetical protein
MHKSAHRLAALLLTAMAGGFLITTTGAAQPRRTTAAKMQIAIHEIWRGAEPPHSIRAKFTIESRNAGVTLASLGSGIAIIYPNISPPKYVGGQEIWTFTGSQALTSKNGTLQFSFRGNTDFVNSKLSSSGQVLTWENERGTWKITDATGVYQGWKGGGRFAAVDPPLETNSEFDGYVTH